MATLSVRCDGCGAVLHFEPDPDDCDDDDIGCPACGVWTSVHKAKRVYKTPVLRELGTVGDLTKNIGAPSTIPGMPPGFPHP